MNNILITSGIVVLLGLVLVVVFATDCCSATSKATASEPKFASISVSDFNDKHKNGVLIDIRTVEEFRSGYIEGALNLDFYSPTFRQEINNLDKDETYYIYCRSGSRTGQTKTLMRSLGFKNVYDLSGGIISWSSSGLPLKY